MIFLLILPKTANYQANNLHIVARTNIRIFFIARSQVKLSISYSEIFHGVFAVNVCNNDIAWAGQYAFSYNYRVAGDQTCINHGIPLHRKKDGIGRPLDQVLINAYALCQYIICSLWRAGSYAVKHFSFNKSPAWLNASIWRKS